MGMRFFGYFFFQIFCCGFTLLDGDQELESHMPVRNEEEEEDPNAPDFCPYSNHLISYRFEYYWQVERHLGDYRGEADVEEENRIREELAELR
jgi:hypothetical protein